MIGGVVTDAQGSAVPGATVTIRNEATGIETAGRRSSSSSVWTATRPSSTGGGALWGAIVNSALRRGARRGAARVQRPSRRSVLGCAAALLTGGRVPGLLGAARDQSFPDPAAHLRDDRQLGLVFTDITAAAGLSHAVNVSGAAEDKQLLLEEMGCGVAFFDYDHDGWLDIFLVNGTSFDPAVRDRRPTSYLYDRDGHLDLFVANYVPFDPARAPRPGGSAYCRYNDIPVPCGPLGFAGGTNFIANGHVYSQLADRTLHSQPLGPGAGRGA